MTLIPIERLTYQKSIRLKKATVFLKSLKIKIIREKEKNYFKFNFKKATNVDKLYLLPKIHTRSLATCQDVMLFQILGPHRKSFGALRLSLVASNERISLINLNI